MACPSENQTNNLIDEPNTFSSDETLPATTKNEQQISAETMVLDSKSGEMVDSSSSSSESTDDEVSRPSDGPMTAYCVDLCCNLTEEVADREPIQKEDDKEDILNQPLDDEDV